MRSLLPALSAAAIIVAACSAEPDPLALRPRPGPVPPPGAPAHTGRLVGSVIAMDIEGPEYPVGTTVYLRANPPGVEATPPAYEAQLTPMPQQPWRHQFAFPAVAPGDYYVVACFAQVGCGYYRHALTRVVATVSVGPLTTSVLHFGVWPGPAGRVSTPTSAARR